MKGIELYLENSDGVLRHLGESRSGCGCGSELLSHGTDVWNNKVLLFHEISFPRQAADR